MAKKIYVCISIVIIIIILIIHYNKNYKNLIESSLVCEKEYLGDKFVQVLISNEKDLKVYSERYEIDERNIKINFKEEVVFMCSLHHAKEFYYREKNTRENGLNVLDITFGKNKQDKLYVYVLKKVDIITWEAAGANVEPSFG